PADTVSGERWRRRVGASYVTDGAFQIGCANMSDSTPVIHSYHEYTQHLEDALSFVRCLSHLSRKHPYLVSLDKQMSRCWNTSVNSNVPSPEDRDACAKSIGAISVDQLTGPIMPAMRAMVPLLGHCQDYFKSLPLPAGA